MAPSSTSLAGSRASIYSTGSNVRTLNRNRGSIKGSSSAKQWYQKPLVSSLIYTDLQHGSWHIGFYSLFLSIWTTFTSGLDIYLLHESTPGSSHTGYYIISFDFVYVGNPDVRNLLMMCHVLSMFGGIALFFTTCALLDGLRKENERAFRPWLWTMGIFAPFKIIAWIFVGVVSDMIFPYNILMTLMWFLFNLLNCYGWAAIYSLHLELTTLTKLQDMARLKSMSQAGSRVASLYGSRPTSPQVLNRHPATAPSLDFQQVSSSLQSSQLPTIIVTNNHQPVYEVSRGQTQTHSSDIY